LRNKHFSKYAKITAIKIAKKILPNDKHVGVESKYKLLVIFTDDKLLMKAISNLHPITPIVLITSEKELLNYYSIHYGIQTYFVDNLNKAKENYKAIANKAISTTYNFNKPVLIYLNRKFYEI